MSETKNNCRLFTANGLRFDGCGSAREADYIHTARRRAKDGTARNCASNILQIFGFGNGGVRASKLGVMSSASWRRLSVQIKCFGPQVGVILWAGPAPQNKHCHISRCSNGCAPFTLLFLRIFFRPSEDVLRTTLKSACSRKVESAVLETSGLLGR